MTNEEEEIVKDLKENFKRYKEYTYLNYPKKLTKEIIEEVEGKQQTIQYAVLYEAYLNAEQRARENEYKLYQIGQYIDNEIVMTRDGPQFLKYTKEGRVIKDIKDGKKEYKAKRK